jgi:hypothetical protein
MSRPVVRQVDAHEETVRVRIAELLAVEDVRAPLGTEPRNRVDDPDRVGAGQGQHELRHDRRTYR